MLLQIGQGSISCKILLSLHVATLLFIYLSVIVVNKTVGWAWQAPEKVLPQSLARTCTDYCKTLIFSEPLNLAKLAIEIKTLKIKAAKIN